MGKKIRVAIISSSLGIGGAEKSSAHLSFLVSNLGCEVHNIIITDVVQYEYKGSLLNLGKLDEKYPKLFRGICKGFVLRKHINEKKIDVIIDNRTRPNIVREFFAKAIYGRRQKIYVVRSSKLDLYLSKYIFLARMIYKHPAKIVCVSEATEEKVNTEYNLLNTTTINNPVKIDTNTYSKPEELPDNYFLFFGRIENSVKNLSLLMDAFCLSKATTAGFKLVIIGNGNDKQWLLDTIRDKKMQNHIITLPFKKEIQPYIQHAYCSLLTSHFEGFPRMILEALAIGTPVISVDCETGPKELIQNRTNGLLVENHNITVFSNAINELIDNSELYQNCKKNTQSSIQHLTMEKISEKWKQVINV